MDENTPVLWLPERWVRTISGIQLTKVVSTTDTHVILEHAGGPGFFTPIGYVLEIDKLDPVPTPIAPVFLARIDGAQRLQQYSLSDSEQLLAKRIQFGILNFAKYSEFVTRRLALQ